MTHGTTRSRVNVFIGTFKRVGFVEENNGRLYVCTWRLPIVRGGESGIERAASAAVSPALTSEESRWRKAG